MKLLTQYTVGLVIDQLYTNYSKRVVDQVSLRKVAERLSLAPLTVSKIRKILIDQKIMICEGERRSQICFWNPEKCKPNPMMLTHIYRLYLGENDVRKVKVKKSGSISLESALKVLVRLGYTGKVSRVVKVSGHTSYSETIDLSKVEVRE